MLSITRRIPLSAACLSVLMGLFWLLCRALQELQTLWTWDSQVYIAVAKAWIEGRELYADVFDIKPPMIFVISKLAVLAGDPLVTTGMFQTGALAVTGASLVLASRRIKTPLLRLSTLGITLALAAFGAAKSLGYNADLFGLAFCTAAVAMLFTQAVSLQFGAFAALTVLCKETYAPGLIACLLFAWPVIKKKTQRDFLRAILMAAIVYFAFLALTGTLLHYFDTYLPEVLGHRSETSPAPLWKRSLRIDLLGMHLYQYRPALLAGLVVLCGLGAASELLEKTGTARAKLVWFLRVGVGAWFVHLGIGLPGEFFHQHYVMPMPPFMALTLSLAIEFSATSLLSAALPFIALLCNLPGNRGIEWSISRPPITRPQEGLIEAARIDEVILACGYSGYTYVGSIDMPAPLALTRRAPEGPIVGGLNLHYMRDDFSIVTKFYENLARAPFVVYRNPVLPDAHKKRIQAVLDSEFTTTPPACAQSLATTDALAIYYFRR